MELETHICRINHEHSYALKLVSDYIQVEQDIHCINSNTTVKNALILIKEIPTWNGSFHSSNHEYLLAGSVQTDREILLLQKKYEETIQCLQSLIKNILKVAVRKEEKSSELQAHTKIKKLDAKLDEAFITQKDSRTKFIEELRLNHLKFALKPSAELDIFSQNKNADHLPSNLQKVIKAKEQDIQSYKKALELMSKHEHNLRTRLRNIEVRCFELARDLKNGRKQCVKEKIRLSNADFHLDIVEAYVKDSFKFHKDFRERLIRLNEDVKCLVEGQLLNCPEHEDNSRLQSGEAKRFISEDLEPPNYCSIADIDIGLYVLKKNLVLLKDELLQKTEQCSFLEAESTIMREELKKRSVE